MSPPFTESHALLRVFIIDSLELYSSAEVDSRKAAVSKFNEVSLRYARLVVTRLMLL